MDGSAILIIIGMIIHTAMYRRRNHFEDRLFFYLLLSDILIAVSDLTQEIVNGRVFAGAEMINLTAGAFIYISQAAFGLLLLLYLFYGVCEDQKKVMKYMPFISIPALVITIMYLIGIPNGYFLEVKEGNIYQYAKLYPVPVIIVALYGVASFVIAFLYKRKKKAVKYIPLLLYVIPVAAVFIVPYLFHGISMSAIGFSIVLAYMHLGVMNEAFFGEVR